MKALTKEDQQAITSEKAIELLKEGNQRFVQKKQVERDLMDQVKDTATGQNPFACILSCIDSRVSAELVFDQGVGDVFSCRVAGNVLNEDVLGSIEFACKAAGSKLIVVLGHTSCGAVKGACDNVEMGNLTTLLDKLKPAVEAENTTEGDRSSKNVNFVNNVAKINVEMTKEEVKKRSPILKEMIDNNEIGLVGAMYHVEDGRVEFYED